MVALNGTLLDPHEKRGSEECSGRSLMGTRNPSPNRLTSDNGVFIYNT